MPLGKMSPRPSRLPALKLFLSCMKTGRCLIASLLCSLKLTFLLVYVTPHIPGVLFFYHCTKYVVTKYLCLGYVSIVRVSRLVATQLRAPLSRHSTLCCDMEYLMSWNSLLQRKVYSVTTPLQETLSQHTNSLSRHEIP